MKDSLLEVTNSIRNSLASLKKKTASIKSSIVSFEIDLDKLDIKLDKLSVEADIYKNRVHKEASKEIKELQLQVEELEESLDSVSYLRHQDDSLSEGELSSVELARVSTMAIVESILGQISFRADDFKTISYAFLFPALYETLSLESSTDYLLSEVPTSAQIVVDRGRQFLKALREVCETPLTDQESWDSLNEEVADWWRGEGLPLMFGRSRETWKSVRPYSLDAMVLWKSDIADRVLNFPEVFDSFENYREHKDKILSSSGINDFELKQFSLIKQ